MHEHRHTEEQKHLLAQVAALLDAGEAVALLTLVEVRGRAPREPGAKMAVLEDGRLLGSLGGGAVEEEARRQAQEVLDQGRPRLAEIGEAGECGGQVVVFMDPLRPRDVLVIVGAGHVGQALARAAPLAGFQVTLLDDRPDRGGEVRVVAAMDQVFAGMELRADTRVVIATRSHELDLLVLRQALALPCRYIGLLGSRRKRETFFAALRGQGVQEQDLARVHCPVGVDIGASSPGEIAVSILAELIALKRTDQAGSVPLTGTPRTGPHTP